MKDHKNPRPYIHHSVCPQSGLQELWLMCGDKVLAGPARLPDGWVSLYNIAKMDADMDFNDLDTTAKPPAAQARNKLIAVLTHMKHWRRDGVDDAAIEMLESVIGAASKQEQP